LNDTNSQTCENRTSTSSFVPMRTGDILSSMEYRELEKKNKDLSTKVQNLRDALKKLKKEQKAMEQTHICKLSARHHRYD
jgi:wobble nucleotide-excising tRNase